MSQRDSGYARKERDLYETPEWVTEALIEHLPERALRSVWEPACATGKMVRPLERAGAKVMATDIEQGVDFLTTPLITNYPLFSIITNPPYELGKEFCEQAIAKMEAPKGLVAMLMRTDFDHAKGRAHLFGDCKVFSKKVVLRKRIVWFEPEPGAKGKSPSFNHAWFIWDWCHVGAPTLAYGP